VRPELVSLLSDQFENVTAVVSRDEEIPSHDLVLPLLSLPRVLGLDVIEIAPAPYLTPKNRDHPLLPRSSSSGVRIALAWAGSPTQKNDRNRSLPLMAMAPLLIRSAIDVYSVQKGPASAQTGESSLAFAITDLSPIVNDFADT
jgi:hypothetical protein